MTSPSGSISDRSLSPWWASWVLALLLAAAFSVVGLASSTSPATAANVALGQCNNLNGGPLGATTGITCDITVVNTVSSTGATSSTVTVVRQCSLEPCPPGNGSFTTSSSDLVTDITQCNGSGNDAAPPRITCTVTVTNNISAGAPGADPVTAATVNQCNGTGTGGGLFGGVGPLACDPFPATTTGATITQCNGSVTGGGSTAACTVGTASTVSPAVPVRINQCNGTGNKGGTLLTCRSTIRTNLLATPTPTPTPTATSTPTATPSQTATRGPVSQVTLVPSGGVPAGSSSTATTDDVGMQLMGGLLLIAAATSALWWRRAGRKD